MSIVETQSTTKVAEEQLPIIPDVEQMIRYTKDEKNIRNVQYPHKESMPNISRKL